MKYIRLLTIILILVCGCVQEQAQEAFFCPEDNCEDRTILAIGNAESSINAAMYSFTSKEIFEALLKAKEKGIETRIVLDYLQSKSKYSLKDELLENGFEVRVMPSGKTMHNKFVIIDQDLVITGSYNWTKNADTRNKENLVYIFDKKISQEFEEEFFELWVEAG